MRHLKSHNEGGDHMANDTQAQKVEEQAQPEPMPSSEEKVPEQVSTQEVVGETQEASEVSAEGSESKLPDGVSERTTKEFDKLNRQTQDLRDQVTKLQDQSTPEPVQTEKPLYDKATGLVDIEALEQVRKDAREAKVELNQFRQQSQTDRQNQELNEMHEAYPELKDKKTKEATELFDESEKIYLHSQAYPDKYGGNPLTQKKAVDLAKGSLDKTETPEEEAERLEPKEQAALSASGKPTQGVQKELSEDETKRLSLGTRMDDKDSITTRMRNLRESQETQ